MQVDDILSALSQALTDAVRAAGDASGTSRREHTTAPAAGIPSVRITVEAKGGAPPDATQAGVEGGAAIRSGESNDGSRSNQNLPPQAPGAGDGKPTGSTDATDQSDGHRGDPPPKPGRTRVIVGRRDPAACSQESAACSSGDAATAGDPPGAQPDAARTAAAAPAAAADRAGGATLQAPLPHPDHPLPCTRSAAERRWWNPRSWRRHGDVAGGAADSGGCKQAAAAAPPSAAGAPPAPQGVLDATPAKSPAAQEAVEGDMKPCSAEEGDPAATSPDSTQSLPSPEHVGPNVGFGDAGDVGLPQGVAEQFRKVLRRVVAGVAPNGRVHIRGDAEGVGGDAADEGGQLRSTGAESRGADAEQMHSLRSGAEADLVCIHVCMISRV